MTSPKTDDGNKALGQCNANVGGDDTYIGGGGACAVPPNAPVDRNNQPIYGCVNMSGNHSTGCRSIPLNGHPQDYNRKLFNTDTNQLHLGWEERGIELYENFGLSEEIFPYGGNYGSVGPDTDSGGWRKCKSGTTTGSGNHECQNRCITELGRKISLFGQLGFTFYAMSMSYGSTDPQSPPFGVGNQTPNGFVRPPPKPGTAGFGYVVNFYSTIRNDGNDTYEYFGNSGVIFKDADNSQYVFIYGKTPYIIGPDGSKTNASDDVIANYMTVDPDNDKNIYIDAKFFNPNISSMIGINCASMSATFSSTDNCSGSANRDGINTPALPFPFPGNWYSQQFCDVGTNVYPTQNTPYQNCSYSGVRSMYIPPHMRVDGFSTLEYYDNLGSWKSATGTTRYDIVNHNDITPFTYDMSPYKNGVFPSLVGSTSNSPLASDEFTATSNQYFTSTSYFSPAIHNCSLMSIWVNVKRDAGFRNTYINRWYSNSRMLPEILLIPGIQNSTTFMNSMLQVQPNPNPLQKITDPQKFWSSSNDYWDGTVVQLNKTKQVYDALPTTATATTTSATFAVMDPVMYKLPSVLKKPYQLVKGGVMMAGRPINFTTVTGKPTGTGRITTFDVCNGVFSLEWLYVIYTCAYSYAPGQANGLIYDPTTKQYQCNDESTCRKECMLFRDPYYASNYSSTSASDMFMKNYCFTKNVTLAYASLSDPATNDCSCTASMSYCAGAFDSSCQPSLSTGQSTYIPDYILSSTADCSDVCSYCKAVNVQLNFASGSATVNPNDNIKTVGACSGSSTCISTDSDDTGSGGTTNVSDSNSSNTWIYILIILVIIIVAIVIGYYVYKKRYVR